MPAPRTSKLPGLILLCLGLLLPPQARTQDIRYLRPQSWSTEDGLPQNSVHQVVQTADGFLWIATEAGLARFDGVTFRVFDRGNEPTLTSDDISSLAAGKDGDLWAGTADGLIRLHQGSFERITEQQGLPSNAIRAIATLPNGGVFVLTTSGLAQFQNGHLEPVPNTPPNIQAISPAGKDAVWLVASGRPILLRNSKLQPGPENLSNAGEPLAGIAEGPNATLWTFSNTTVSVLASDTIHRWKVGSTLPGSRIETLEVDRAGTAWVGTNDGLALLTATSIAAEPVPSLRGDAILTTFHDREANTWIGSETSGLHILRLSKFRTEPELANLDLTSVVQTTPVDVWVGTREDGLRRIRHGTVDNPIKPGSLTSPVILSLAPGDHGSLWAGTPDGLNHILPNGSVTRMTSADGLPDDYVQTLLAAPDASLWAGTRHGLVHVRGTKMDVLTRADGLGGDLIGMLFLDATQNLWIATSGGLSRLAADGRITNLTTPPGIVTAMAQDAQGSLWAAIKGGGVGRVSQNAWQPIASPSLTGTIYGMATDQQDVLWLRKDRGIDRVSLKELTLCAEATKKCQLSISHFGLADGMPSEEIVAGTSPVLWQMAGGELWSATRRGIAIADPNHLPINTTEPLVAIERFLVDETTIPSDQSPIRIPYGHGRFTMEYAGLSFTQPSAVRYRFKLDGFDPTWTEAGTRRTATYTNLSPGTYHFHVQATNNDGLWSAEDAPGSTLQFTVVPPFYRRWWFLALAILALAGISIAMYRLRLRRMQARFDAVLNERNRMAREIHDTLAQDFVGVSVQLDLVSQMLSRSLVEAAIEQVRQTRKLVTDGLADARQSIWELRANLAQDSLPTRLGKAVERYAEAPCPVHSKIGGAYRKLDPRIENEVLRIAQESLSNIQRHAHATSASIDLHYGRDMLVLTVEDDGRGFSTEAARTAEGHYGLHGMEERAAVLGGKLEITSKPGAGTRVRLATPIGSAPIRNEQEQGNG